MRSSSLRSSASTGVAALLILVLVCPATMAQTVEAKGFDAPAVSVVLGRDAPELERLAAAELCRYLDSLYAIKVKPAAAPAKSAEVTLLLGSPQTNPAVRTALGADGWPHITDQGIVLKHVKLDGKPGLVIGGGSPRACLWAVYELAERWGVHYLLHGDVLPREPE